MPELKDGSQPRPVDVYADRWVAAWTAFESAVGVDARLAARDQYLALQDEMGAAGILGEVEDTLAVREFTASYARRITP
jgi:hypothetical protein